LDVIGGSGDDGTGLEAWECNGQESQLWYFDNGAYQIQWAGDSSKCIDAGDFSQGNQLILWDCNGEYQQKWTFDGTIYLMIDNPMCMDLWGGSTDSGTAVVLWDCLHLWSQTWIISSGITIRTQANYQLCLDLAGGSSDNGTPIQLWECNGQWPQKWLFDDWQIKLASDSSKCIDSGGFGAGNALMLWDCNGEAQQFWGLGDDGSIYMSSSSADAAFCMDIPGGNLDGGTQVGVYDCNQCWNQLFDVVGPYDGMTLHQSEVQQNVSLKRNLGVGDCPGGPSPSPSPAPAGGGSHCTGGDQYGWPVFDDEASLWASNWAGYFQDVYGEVPQMGYPICIYNFWWLYTDVKANHGCDEQGYKPRKCPKSEGDYYKKNNMFDTTIKNSGWIYHGPKYSGIPENTWAEVTHAEVLTTSGEGHGMWFFYTEGSGLWYWIGTTRVYKEHQAAAQDLCGHAGGGFDASIQCAQDLGFNSVQFTAHRDPEWSCSTGVPGNKDARGIEIVGTIGVNGDKLTGTKPCGNKSGQGVLRAGWEASQECYCDNSKKMANCANGPGYPPNYR